jgi:GH15 family glucan-1,4-alpha-glucosidase
MMPIVGFLPADDPRMLATIDSTINAAWVITQAQQRAAPG